MSRGQVLRFPAPEPARDVRAPAQVVGALRRLASGEDDLRLARQALEWIATWAPDGARPVDVLGRMLVQLRRGAAV